MYHNIGNFIANKRKELGMTQQKLADPWYSGELIRCYHDWMFRSCEEVIFDCNSGGIPHKHCMQTVITEKLVNDK